MQAFTSTECTMYSFVVSRGMASGARNSSQRARPHTVRLISYLPDAALAEQTARLQQQDENEQHEARRVLESGRDVTRRELLAQSDEQAAYHAADPRLQPADDGDGVRLGPEQRPHRGAHERERRD